MYSQFYSSSNDLYLFTQGMLTVWCCCDLASGLHRNQQGSRGVHRLEKCFNFNPSALKVLEFVIGLEKEQNALKSAWKFVKVFEKVTSQGLLPLNVIELHHYSEF